MQGSSLAPTGSSSSRFGTSGSSTAARLDSSRAWTFDCEPGWRARSAGDVWFTVQQSDMYGRLDPRTGDVKTWRVPIAHALPYGMQRAPDGTIWVALFGTNRLGHIDPKSGALDQIMLPNDGSRPRRLVVDASGVVWYTDYARNRLGSYDPRTHAAHE